MSRGLAYWNDERIAFIKEHFVAVAVPTWVRHAEGPEGEFLRKAGIDKRWVTSSGYMSCLSASGEYLGDRPTEEVLEAFEKLPESERAAGAVEVPELAGTERLIVAPPEGGLVLKVHARFLTREEEGGLRPATTSDFPLMRAEPRVLESWALFLEPNTEAMWLTAAEVEGLVPEEVRVGQRVEVNPAIPMRLARFHLNPKRATTSEGGIVREGAVKVAEMALVAESVSKESLSMRVEGKVRWGSDYKESEATSPNGELAMGYEAELLGRVDFDRKAKVVTRFDVVAPGEVWGRWGDANNKSMYVERAGREPFGFALELAKGESPTERIPPGGNGRYVEERGYFAEAK